MKYFWAIWQCGHQQPQQRSADSPIIADGHNDALH
jgi:hypothetical protein